MNANFTSVLLRCNPIFRGPRFKYSRNQRSHFHLLHQITYSKTLESLQYLLQTKLEWPTLPSLDHPVDLEVDESGQTKTLPIREVLDLIQPGTCLVPAVAENHLNDRLKLTEKPNYRIVPLSQRQVAHVGKKYMKRAANEIYLTPDEPVRSAIHKLSASYKILSVGRQLEIHICPKPKCNPPNVASKLANSLHLHPLVISAAMPKGTRVLGEVLMETEKTGQVILLLASPGWPEPNMIQKISRIRHYLAILKALFPPGAYSRENMTFRNLVRDRHQVSPRTVEDSVTEDNNFQERANPVKEKDRATGKGESATERTAMTGRSLRAPSKSREGRGFTGQPKLHEQNGTSVEGFDN